MDPPATEGLVEPVSAPARRVAPGGWRRGAVGVALGVVAGLLVATGIPRDRGGAGGAGHVELARARRAWWGGTDRAGRGG